VKKKTETKKMEEYPVIEEPSLNRKQGKKEFRVALLRGGPHTG
jgi:hypothetical protein